MADMHDGVQYTFPRNQPITIPLAAAKHILGFDEASGRADFIHVQRRWGWNTPETTKHAQEWFNNILVEPVVLRQVEIPANLSEEDFNQALEHAQVHEPPVSSMM